MNKIQDALKNEELMFEVGRKATEEQISVLQQQTIDEKEKLTPEELLKKRISELKLLQSMQAKKKNVEKYIRVMAATKDDTQRTNLGVKLTKLLKNIIRNSMELTAQERKERPVFSGVIKYFPDALLEVAHASYVGNQQHNKDMPLHWDKSKSTDEPDALIRHLMLAGTYDTDGVRHSAKVAWRALALLQREIDKEKNTI